MYIYNKMDEMQRQEQDLAHSTLPTWETAATI